MVKTASKLGSWVLVEIDGVKKTRVKHYASLTPNWVKHLRTFGEAGTVRTGNDGKVVNRGVTIDLFKITFYGDLGRESGF